MTRATKAPTTPAERLHKLARAKRSRANLEKVQALLEEIKDNIEPLGELADEIQTLNDALAEVQEKVTNVDDSLLPSRYVSRLEDALRVLDGLLPANEDPALNIAELIDSAQGTAEEYESSLDDTDMAADDRESIWEQLTEQLTEIGDGFDSFQALADKEPTEAGDDE